MCLLSLKTFQFERKTIQKVTLETVLGNKDFNLVVFVFLQLKALLLCFKGCRLMNSLSLHHLRYVKKLTLEPLLWCCMFLGAKGGSSLQILLWSGCGGYQRPQYWRCWGQHCWLHLLQSHELPCVPWKNFFFKCIYSTASLKGFLLKDSALKWTVAQFLIFFLTSIYCKLYLFHVGQKGLPVQIPFLMQLRGLRMFAAAQLHGDFQTVSVEVIVVLHPPWITWHQHKHQQGTATTLIIDLKSGIKKRNLFKSII